MYSTVKIEETMQLLWQETNTIQKTATTPRASDDYEPHMDMTVVSGSVLK